MYNNFKSLATSPIPSFDQSHPSNYSFYNCKKIYSPYSLTNTSYNVIDDNYLSTNISPNNSQLKIDTAETELLIIETDWLQSLEESYQQDDGDWKYIQEFICEYTKSQLVTVINSNITKDVKMGTHAYIDVEPNEMPSTVVEELEIYSDVKLNNVRFYKIDPKSYVHLPEDFENVYVLCLDFNEDHNLPDVDSNSNSIIISKNINKQVINTQSIGIRDLYFTECDNETGITINNTSLNNCIVMIVYYKEVNKNNKIPECIPMNICKNTTTRSASSSARRKLCFYDSIIK